MFFWNPNLSVFEKLSNSDIYINIWNNHVDTYYEKNKVIKEDYNITELEIKKDEIILNEEFEKKNLEDSINLTQIFKDIYPDITKDYKNLFKVLKSNSIKLETLTKIFSVFSDEKCESELVIMGETFSYPKILEKKKLIQQIINMNSKKDNFQNILIFLQYKFIF
jgi:hypothetical protein